MLDPDLLVVGRQVETDRGHKIDLLCIDADGALVVAELKRGRTPRDVIAQTLDYASWVQEIGAEEIEAIANAYLADKGPLEEAFKAKFDDDLPAVLNESHRSLVVAESIDDGTERVVRYLANLGVPINVATVQHFTDQLGRELLAQVYLMEPEELQRTRPRRQGGTPLAVTRQQQQDLADMCGVGELFAKVSSGVADILTRTGPPHRVTYWLRTDEGRRTVFIVLLSDDEATAADGMRLTVHVDRFRKYLGVSRDQLESALPEDAQESHEVRNWRGATDEEKSAAIGIRGNFHTVQQVDAFVRAVREAADRRGKS